MRSAFPHSETTSGISMGEIVAEAFGSILGVEPVGLHDNFFALGGDSLGAIRLVANLNAEYGLSWDPSKVFLFPTAASLGAAIRESYWNGDDAFSAGEGLVLKESGSASDQMEYPPSCQQRKFWILHQTTKDPAAYNVLQPLRLTGSVDSDLIEEAFFEVVRRYRVYRTVYRETDGGLRALVLEDLLPGFVSEVIPDDAGKPFFSGIERLNLDMIRPFDLENESPVRARLVRLNEEEHLLGFTFHHIACDGVSYNLFLESFRIVYGALRESRDLPLLGGLSQYEGFAEGQWRESVSRKQIEALSYWVRELVDAPRSIPFPRDPGLSDASGCDDGEVSLPIGDLQDFAKELARQEATTLSVVYLAAYFAWLHRISGMDDMVVAVPVDSRFRREHQSVQGCCINMLCLRIKISVGTAFRDLLSQVHQKLVEGLRFAETPYLTLVEALQKESGEVSGIYDTIFQYRGFAESVSSFGGVRMEVVWAPKPLAQLPVMIEVYANSREPLIGLAYQGGYIGEETARRWLKQYLILSRGALGNPDMRLENISLMDDPDYRLVSSMWSANRVSVPNPASVNALFSEQVAKYPDSTALIWHRGEMSYRELDAQSSWIASKLRWKGVGFGDRVGICLDRSPEFIVGILAILKAGAVYVPLDPEYPIDRLKFMAADADLRVVITDRPGLGRVNLFFHRAWLIEHLSGGSLVGPGPAMVDADAAAYLMYTSGSTGQPKGVLVPHRGIVRLVNRPDYVRIGPSDTLLQLSSMSFDAATFEIWGALLNGGRLALMPPVTPSIRDLGEAVRNYEVTVLWLTAGLFHLVVEEKPEILKPVVQLIAGGDVLHPHAVKACLDSCPELKLVNGYGPTENTTFSCCHLVERGFEVDRPVPIGRPIAGSEAYVLDKRLQPVPVGTVGELCLGGRGLALGYWRRGRLTAERFVPHPFSAEPGGRLYLTGDRARFLPDGSIEFLGRSDRQVKVRGFRVELEEIEKAITGLALVTQSVVLTQTSRNDLVAFLVLTGPDAQSLEEVKVSLRRRLPGYMIPNHWMVLGSFPLTSNGKVDRRALVELWRESEKASWRPDDGGAVNSTETGLLGIWRRLFDRETIGCDDNFFDLGGNSLMAIRFVAEAERELGIRVSLTRLFQKPTIRSLAEVYSSRNASPRWSSVVPLKPGGHRLPLFISHGWGGSVFPLRDLANEMHPDQPVYGLQAVELAGDREPFDSIEAMAAHYVSEIQSVQPSGPYLLLGYSVGGMIAFEIASQLRRANKQIGMVFVLDSYPFNLPKHVQIRGWLPHFKERLLHHLANLLFQGRKLDPRFLLRRMKALKFYLDRCIQSPEAGVQGALEMKPGKDHYHALGERYIPHRCPMPVTLMMGSDLEQDLTIPWRYLGAKPLDVVPINVDHWDILNFENMRTLIAPVIRERLERLQCNEPLSESAGA